MNLLRGILKNGPFDMTVKRFFSFIRRGNRGKWKNWGWILDFYRIKEFESP